MSPQALRLLKATYLGAERQAVSLKPKVTEEQRAFEKWVRQQAGTPAKAGRRRERKGKPAWAETWALVCQARAWLKATGQVLPTRAGPSAVLDAPAPDGAKGVQGVEVVEGPGGFPPGPGLPQDGGRPFSDLLRHITALPACGLFGVRYACYRAGNTVLRVKGEGPFRGQEWQGGVKAAMAGWSKKSRLSCYYTFCAVNWPEDLVFVSLTWPGDLGKSPKSGPEAKAKVDAFLRRWARAYGKGLGAWKREFQKRGSLHYHLWLKSPPGASQGELRAFVSKAWNEIAGSGDGDHLAYGAKVERWQGSPARYLLKEMGIAGSKQYQNEVPEGFEKPGRFWGLLGGLKVEWEKVPVEYRQAVQIRRSMGGLLRARGCRFRFRGPTCGVSLIARGPETVDKLVGQAGEGDGEDGSVR